MNYLAIDLGTITPPESIPTIPPEAGAESSFVSGFVSGGLQLLLIVAFIIALIWTILAGLKFITASGDEKGISSAWSQIYFGLIGMVVVLGAFAIMRLVEVFFGVDIISGDFLLPTR